MKKVILLIVSLIIPFYVSASSNTKNYSIDAIYITCDADILGSMHVKEAIVINGKIDNFERKINYKNPDLPEWNVGDVVDFKSSALYNARGASLSKVSAYKITKEEIGWDLLNYRELFDKVDAVEENSNGVYTLSKDDYSMNINIYNENNNGYMVYYIDYYINQALVLHNDVAEIYWQFIPSDFDDVKEAHIQLTIPGNSTKDIFKYYAHGPLTGEIVGISTDKDENDEYLYRGVLVNVTDIKKGQGLDIRVTFDRNIYAGMAYILDESGVDALDEIIKIETDRINEANANRTIVKTVYYGLIALSVLYSLGLISMWVFIYRKYSTKYKISFKEKYNKEIISEYGIEVVDYLMNDKTTVNGISSIITNMIHKNKINVINSKDEGDITLELVDKSDLTNIEKIIVDLLFNKAPKGNKITLKEIDECIKKRENVKYFTQKYDELMREIKKNVSKEKLVIDVKNKKIYACCYSLLGVLIVVFMVIFKSINIPSLILVLVLTMAFITYALNINKYTNKGEEHYLRWNALKNYLKDTTITDSKQWDKYLVYVDVLGLREVLKNNINKEPKDKIDTAHLVAQKITAINSKR